MEDFVSAPWLRRLISVVLLAGLVLLGFRVIAPFIVPVVWASILAYVSWPAYAWLVRKLQRPGAAGGRHHDDPGVRRGDRADCMARRGAAHRPGACLPRDAGRARRRGAGAAGDPQAAVDRRPAARPDRAHRAGPARAGLRAAQAHRPLLRPDRPRDRRHQPQRREARLRRADAVLPVPRRRELRRARSRAPSGRCWARAWTTTSPRSGRR